MWLITMLIGIGLFVYHGWAAGDWRSLAAAGFLLILVAVIRLYDLYDPSRRI